MANLISGGPLAMDFRLSGDRNPYVANFLQQQSAQNIQHLGPQHSVLLQQSVQYIEDYHNSDIMRQARAALGKSSHAYNVNAIYPLLTLEALQNAPEIMIPYIMAEPTIREAYHAQRLEGYDGLYRDAQPGVVGMNHQHYQAATNGLSVKDPYGSDRECFINYLHLEKVDQLSFDQKLAIQRTWMAIKEELAKGEDDPTSMYGGLIG